MLESKIYFGRVLAQDKSWTPSTIQLTYSKTNVSDRIANPVRHRGKLS
jgi:hypothetical protein